MNKITVDYIQALDYTDFIAFIKETNRCPGGKSSIREIAKNTFLEKDSRILDVGSNTGFNSLEFAHITKARIYGIDISENCVNEANIKLSSDNGDIKKRVSFSIGSAYNIPFGDEYFDLVMCGGATSFMDNKNKAVREYFRVLKPWGFLATTQLFYNKKPPKETLDEVSKVIGVKVNYLNKNDWLKILNAKNQYELYYFSEYSFERKSKSDAENYVSIFLKKTHLAMYDKEVKQAIYDKWLDYITIFAKNNDYLSYFIAIFRKNLYLEEEEFFVRGKI